MVEKITRLEKEAGLLDDSYAEVHTDVFIFNSWFLSYKSEIYIGTTNF